MEKIDFKELGMQMLHAMEGPIKDHFEQAKEIADGELEGFAKRTAELANKVVEGKISEDQARAILRIRKASIETVLLSISGIGIVAAQQAINAAIGVLIGVIAKAIPGVNIL